MTMPALDPPHSLRFWVRATPRQQPRPRAQVVHRAYAAAYAHIYTPDTARSWRRNVIFAARQAAGFPASPWTGAVGVTITFVFPRPRSRTELAPEGDWYISRPDIDNLVKALLDALTPPRRRADAIRVAAFSGYLWRDDAQVCDCRVRKCYAGIDQEPGAQVLARLLVTPPGGTHDLPR